MKENSKVNHWVSISDYDLETAIAMLNSGRLLYVGFMCHQAIEKILKAYYLFVLKEEPIYTHNLKLLADKTGLYLHLTEEQKNLINQLMPFNIETRYPSYKMEILKQLTKEKCDVILNSTKEFSSWIKQKL